MMSLYLVFALVGIVLFLGIYLYSRFQLKRMQTVVNDDDRRNKKQSVSGKTVQQKIEPSISVDKPSVAVGGVTAEISSYSNSSLTPDVDGAPLEQLAQELEQSAQVLEVDNGTTEENVGLHDLLLDNEKDADVMGKTENEATVIPSDQIDIFTSQEENDNIADSDVAATTNKDQSTTDDSAAKKEHTSQLATNHANAMEIVANISGQGSVGRDSVLATYRNYDYLFTRKVGIYGKNILTKIWENLELADPANEFSDVAVALQLADKTGAMTRKESNTFSTMAMDLADKMKRRVVFSMDIDQAVERGRELDDLARKFDAMVVCNIIPKRRQGFRSTDIKSCTRDLNMVQSQNGVFGRFEQVNDKAVLRYSLAVAGEDGKYVSVNASHSFYVSDIVLFIKVPLVEKPELAFDLMIQDARRLSAWLDGKVVDKNGRNMSNRTLQTLAEQIGAIETEMASQGLHAGSELCKKLF